MKKHHPIYNVIRRDHTAVKAVAKTVLEEIEKDRSADGIIVVLARQNGRKTVHYMAGSLSTPSKAAFESFVVQLAMGIAKARE